MMTLIFDIEGPAGSAFVSRGKSRESDDRQPFNSFLSLSAAPRRNVTHQPRSTFTRSFFLSLESYTQWWWVTLDGWWWIKSCAWLAVLGPAPFTRWPVVSRMRAPTTLPWKVRSSVRIRRSISPCHSHGTVMRIHIHIYFLLYTYIFFCN